MHFLSDTLLAQFWQWIQPVDLWLLTHINQDWSNGFLDTVLPFFRETLFWFPLYLFLLLTVVTNFPKQGWWWVLGVVLTAALADIVSSQVIKENIMRLRPCQDPEVAHQIRFFVKYCPKSSSFTSSHSTSHFAQAMFFFLTLRGLWPKAWLFFLWAGAIAFTQVYVAVHYPFDVTCGALLGCGIGFLMAKLYHKHSGMLSLEQ
jgi:membrane-associated phospholipid phosphatase